MPRRFPGANGYNWLWRRVTNCGDSSEAGKPDVWAAHPAFCQVLCRLNLGNFAWRLSKKQQSLKVGCLQIGASACASDEFQLIGATDSHTCPRGLPCRAGRQPRSHQHAEQPPECRQSTPLFPNWAANLYHALQAAVLTKAATDCIAAAGKSPQAQVSEPLKTSGEDTDEDDEDEESEEPVRKGPGRKKRTAPILVETEDGETKYVSPAEFRKLRRCASGITACSAMAFRDPCKPPTPCR